MRKENSKQRSENFFRQLKGYSPINKSWLDKRKKTQDYYKEHFDDVSVDIIKEKLHLLNSAENTRIYNLDSVAERLLEIQNFTERVQYEDDNLILEVVQAFATRGNNSVTWSQFQNALHFLALHSPNKYIEINNYVKGWMEELASGTDHLKGYLQTIPFNKIVDLYVFGKAFYEAIKQVADMPQASYSSIYEKLTDFALAASVVVTNPNLVNATGKIIIDGLDVWLQSQGLNSIPNIPQHSIMRQLGKFIGKSLNPYLKRIHEKAIDELNAHRNNH